MTCSLVRRKGEARSGLLIGANGGGRDCSVWSLAGWVNSCISVDSMLLTDCRNGSPKNLAGFLDRIVDLVESHLVGSLLFGSVVESSRKRIETEDLCGPASSSTCTFACAGVAM